MSANDRSSSAERAETRAFRELETLVRSLGEELAAFRRRALAAEAQLKDGGAAVAPKAGAKSGLEAENEALRTRLQRAEERVRQMMDRVRFLRQQVQSRTTAAAGRS
jgi:predicted  nucleic acid-binding Zn-ribbon protein